MLLVKNNSVMLVIQKKSSTFATNYAINLSQRIP